VFSAVLATLTATYILPESSLACGLNDRWQTLFRTKNADAICRIQDTFRCCGLNSLVDRAWPFQSGSHRADSCVEMFGRTQRCLDPWKRLERETAGMMMVVAIVGWVMEAIILLVIPIPSHNSRMEEVFEEPNEPRYQDELEPRTIEETTTHEEPQQLDQTQLVRRYVSVI